MHNSIYTDHFCYESQYIYLLVDSRLVIVVRKANAWTYRSYDRGI